MRVISYTPDWAADWNRLADGARNGTFLFRRSYMDYHNDRFADCSLVFTDSRGHTAALFPANYDADTRTVWSHQGLTYGGLVMRRDLTYDAVDEIFALITAHYKQSGATRLVYKKVPYIYNVYPSDEDLYALTRRNARLTARAISSAVDLHAPLPLSARRLRGCRKAERAGLIVKGHDADAPGALAEYWTILTQTLACRHQTKPVHSVNEITRLQSLHPSEIRLWTIHRPDTAMLGGTLLYLTPMAVHAQYIATNEEGRRCGALDMLFDELLRKDFDGRRFFDFGISTEQGGTVLNDGLLTQKQEFGGRAVCYDTYTLDL